MALWRFIPSIMSNIFSIFANFLPMLIAFFWKTSAIASYGSVNTAKAVEELKYLSVKVYLLLMVVSFLSFILWVISITGTHIILCSESFANRRWQQWWQQNWGTSFHVLTQQPPNWAPYIHLCRACYLPHQLGGIYHQRLPQLASHQGCCKTLELSHKTCRPEDFG